MRGQAMKITGKTKITGILGDPIGHTLSPAMQNAAFMHMGLDWVYAPFHVKPDSLKKAIEGIRALNLAGVNVTVPHKSAVLKYLDEIDGLAKEIGAVNTVVNKNGKLVGENTDIHGYIQSLTEDAGFVVKNRKIIILGAGGAARAIIYGLLWGGVLKPRSVVVANRTQGRAEDLVREFKRRFKNRADVMSATGFDAVGAHMRDADLLVNATPLGMEGQRPLEIDLRPLPANALVSDVVYKPLETGLLKRAKRRGLRTHSGLGMLVHQGAMAFKSWTGLDAPIEIMKRAALEALRKK